MNLYRIGDKILDKDKIQRVIGDIIALRLEGLSQQEVAKRLGIDRTFISRLEGIGEVHKGRKIGVVGFPIGNKEELEEMLRKEGVEFRLIMTDEERINFVSQKSGVELLNDIMEVVAKARSCDILIILGSNYRIKVCEALVGKEVVGVEIGISPITVDIDVETDKIRSLIKMLKQDIYRE